ncbi:hypothetical protein Btru_047379 [Bulinus truncatus]|nr:hypothetical protein Btru_047379 [Bulinus truncatus]
MEDPVSSTNQTCVNRLGPDSCECRSGFQNVSGQCQDINECDTVLNTCSHDCINIDGSFNCSCAEGFDVTDFDKCQDIDECALKRSSCEHYCTNTIGNYRCFCKDGFQLSSDLFSCLDIDECIDSANNNCTVNQTCYNNIGGFNCSCKAGYFLDINDCKEQMTRNISIKFQYDASNINLNDSSSHNYTQLREAFESLINSSFKENMTDLHSVKVVQMRNGSLIVDASLVLWKIPDEEYIKKVYDGLVHLSEKKNITVLNKSVEVISVIIQGKEILSNQTLCDIFSGAFCRNETSNETSTTPTSTPTSTSRNTGDDTDLTLGLAIGIPLFVVFAVSIVAAVLIWKKKKRSSLFKNAYNSFEKEDVGVFAKSIAKYGSWSKPDTYQQAYDGLSWSSSETGSKKVKTKKRSLKEDKKGENSNFSWDFIYKALEPFGEDYKIQRPKVTPVFPKYFSLFRTYKSLSLKVNPLFINLWQTSISSFPLSDYFEVCNENVTLM